MQATFPEGGRSPAAPGPHPSPRARGASVTSGMDRVGDYVRRALPQALLRNEVDWPCHVEWDEAGVRGTITRGELVLVNDYRAEAWWDPVGKETGDRITTRLGRVLWGYWKLYRESDAGGRLHVPLWRRADGALFGGPHAGAVVVTATLVPGCRLGGEGGAETTLVHRLGERAGRTLREAVEVGWVEVGEP